MKKKAQKVKLEGEKEVGLGFEDFLNKEFVKEELSCSTSFIQNWISQPSISACGFRGTEVWHIFLCLSIYCSP